MLLADIGLLEIYRHVVFVFYKEHDVQKDAWEVSD